MRRFVFAAIALLALGDTASTADLSLPPAYRAPIEPPPTVVGWSGFYFGLNVGGGVGNGHSDFAIVGGPAFASISNHLSGAIGGAQAGFNWQTGITVVGVETDFQAANVKGGISAPCLPGLCGLPLTATYSQNVPWFGTVRGRVGITSGGWLAYATAGYAYGRLETDAVASAGAAAASANLRETRNGWTAGGGIEIAMMPGWSAKLEYLYLDLGRANTTFVLPGLPGVSDDARLTMNIVRVGVNHRF